MTLFRDPRFPFFLGGSICLALVAFGVLLAQTMGLAACPLCIWQRMMYLLYGLLCLAGFYCATRRSLHIMTGLLMTVTAATGAGIAGYQVWIQRFSPATSCAGKEPWWEAFVRWAGEWVPILFKASGLCSDPAWKFLTLSIADWSLLCFCGLLLLAISTTLKKQGR